LRYEFVVDGKVTAGALDQFPGFSATTLPSGTAIFGPVCDDSDVQSVVARLFSLELPVVEVRPLPD
jgi:hypothetical protein